MIVMAGVHGNEKAGIRASQRVLHRLEQSGASPVGDVTFLAGNLSALRQNARFIDLDLNRQWTPEKLAVLQANGDEAAGPAEHAEQRELLRILRRIIDAARGPLIMIDLHTSSAAGPPLLTVGDTLRNRRFALTFPLPLILGLEEQVEGALLELLNNHGVVTLGVEGGSHESPQSVDHHQAVLWHALVSSGILQGREVPDLAQHQELLRKASRGVPPVIEVRYRHPIRTVDQFRMKPGFVNLARVHKGQVLAQDIRGPIRAPETGLILLPLYQGQGTDGFFLSRPVRPIWLAVSFLLRQLRLGTVMRLLPGVRVDPDRPEVLIVNTRVARLYPLEIFHLFGFRKVRQVGTDLLVSRRRYDLAPPRKMVFP
jgi:succinylglutamate desuccinylase